jgi:SsrA-binding protein
LVLQGSEVKSLREGKVTLADAHGRIRDHEAWILDMHIPPYSRSSTHVVVDTDRPRKLLLHRHELERLEARLDQDHLTLVPLRLYFKEGRAKLELALARGRKHHDRRQAIAERDASREAERAMARANRGAGPVH